MASGVREVVRPVRHGRRSLEVLGDGRGLGLPLERQAAPRVLRRPLAARSERRHEVTEREEETEAEDERAVRRERVERLELLQVRVVAARHATRAEEELREERHVEADEDDDAGERRDSLVVEAPGDL